MDEPVYSANGLSTSKHGFATLEASGGFRFDTDVDESVTWMINLVGYA